ncbi:MAG TPA: histidine kinase [Paenibacillus sp.]|nr:histidine kinase [Paenibacillus sp.]
MRSKWFNNYHHLFFRAVTMLLLVTAPLYGMGLYLNERGAASVRNEINRSMEADIMSFKASIDNEIARVAALERQYVADPDILRLGTASEILDDYEKSTTVDEIYMKLELLKNASNYIKNASVHFKQLHRTVSTGGYYQALAQERFHAFAEHIPQPSDTIIPWNNGLYLIVRYPEKSLTQDRDPLFILEIELDRNQIRSALQRFETAPGYGAGIYHDAWSIESEDSIAGSEILEQILDRATGKERDVSAVVPGFISFDGKAQGYWGTYDYSRSLHALIVSYGPVENVLGPLRTYRLSFWGLFALALLVFIVYCYWIYSSIHRPLNKLVRMFRKVEAGEFDFPAVHNANDEFQHIYSQFNKMTGRLRVLIDERLENETRMQRAELKFLQSQIHPHFLYNNFYNVYRMAKAGDLDNILKVSRHLGDYFRFITRNAGDEVPLDKEIEHALNYLEIQSFRFNNRILFETNVAAGLPQIQVPKLIIQPLLENALHHGLEDTLRGGLLRFEAAIRDGWVEIAVEDNGKGAEESELQTIQTLLTSSSHTVESTGLVNVHRRIRLKFGNEAGLLIRRPPSGCFSAVIRIPLKEAQNV